jgi:hypothetical protein
MTRITIVAALIAVAAAGAVSRWHDDDNPAVDVDNQRIRCVLQSGQ